MSKARKRIGFYYPTSILDKERETTPTTTPKSSYSYPSSSYSKGYGEYRSYYYGGHYYEGSYYKDYDWKEAYRSRYSSSLGYSRSRLTDTIYTGYTSYYSSDKSDKKQKQREFFEKAFKAARDLVIILDFPFKVSVQLSQNGSEIKDPNRRRIFIPTRVLEEDEYDETDRISICSGLSIHEAAHLKYTEIKVLTNFYDRLKENISSYKGPINFIYYMANIIEDERIETLLLEERPGYTELIDKAKSYNYNKFAERCKGIVKPSVITPFLINLYRIIRYPEGVEEDVLREHSDAYKKVRDILYPLPESTKETCTVAVKISNELFKIFGEELKDSELYKDLRNMEDVFLSGFSMCLYGFDGDAYDSESSGDIVQPSGELIAKFINNHEIEAKLLCGMAEKVENNTYFERVRGDKHDYYKVVKKISHMVPAIRKILINSNKNYEFNIYGCRSGLLDTSKIAEAYQGVPHVYIRKGEVKTSQIAVCLLVDESGSMWNNHKSETAREAAVLLYEGLKGTGVEFFAYGHTADTINDSSTEIRVYMEKGFTNSPYGLSEIDARRENRDGNAILETAKRVRKLTKSNVLMFVISDGSPCAYNYWGYNARRDVREKVSKVEAMGFNVVQITIDDVRDSKDMFTHVINLEDDLSEFPNRLGKLVKNFVLNNMTTTTTS